ncbi:hypothetical protein POM88_050435 [Heracleum sosnowskyi]|uniref:PB1 domain-containing protein n=1 Tax=Heracleum sosnowskyi TaxID=360622 RepID=A0AAD8GZS9_9APIA|nr:hypothetical protein POM88_050435 [Heracleum sosnowskyi]
MKQEEDILKSQDGTNTVILGILNVKSIVIFAFLFLSSNTRNLTELITAILQRAGDDIDCNNLPQILYEDEDHDQVVLASDSDLVAAMDHAKSAGWKGLKLHLDYSGAPHCRRGSGSGSLDYALEMQLVNWWPGLLDNMHILTS